MVRVALLVPVLLCVMLAGCSREVTEADLVGQWGGYADMSEWEEEYGKLNDTPAFVLELLSDGNFEMHSFAGTFFGDWSVEGDTLVLNMTGMDDGYSDSRESDEPPILWAQFRMKIHSKDKFVWVMPGEVVMSEEVVFERRRE